MKYRTVVDFKVDGSSQENREIYSYKSESEVPNEQEYLEMLQDYYETSDIEITSYYVEEV